MSLKAVQMLRLVLIGVLIGAAVFVYTATLENEASLRVVFFDVGQGDAAFIESTTGVQVLIDGSADGGVLRHLAREMGFFDRTIDLMVVTHPDKDHIGGLPDVLKRYTVHTIVRTEHEGDTHTAKALLDAIEEETHEGAVMHYARRGTAFDLGDGIVLEVLFPDRDARFLESNTGSIITQLVYGETQFLFMGDAPSRIENHLLALDGNGLKSKVLKVGHHGSKTSTGEAFLRVADPDYGVISAGKDNRYGHPHREVVDRLLEYGVITKNTAEDGSIVFTSNGREVFVEPPK